MTLKALGMDKINKTSVNLHRKESQELVPGYFNKKSSEIFWKISKKQNKTKQKRNQKPEK